MPEAAPLFCYFDESDWVIAHSPEDASAVWEAASGAPHNDPDYEWGDALPMGEPLSVTGEDGTSVTKTIEEWIASNGRGFLCSENF